MEQQSSNKASAKKSAPEGLVSVELSRIRRYQGQPRHHFGEASLRALGTALLKDQCVPIKVKKVSGDPKHDYELIDGERRWRAAKLVGITHLLAWVRNVQGKEQFIESVVSNFCREGHTTLEKVDAFARMRKEGMSRQEIAERCGYSIGSVNQHLSLLNLTPAVRERMGPTCPPDQRITMSLALNLVVVRPELQEDMLEELSKNKLPVRQARFLIRKRAHQVAGGMRTKRQPYKDYRIIAGFIRRTTEEAVSINGMPSQLFAGLFTTRDTTEIQLLIEKIEASITGLQKLCDKVKDIKKSSGK